MIRISDRRRGIVRRLVRSFSLAAAAIFALSAVPGQRAEALSLINPGAVPTAKYASEGLTTEVRGHGGHGGGYHGGGGFRGGGAVYRGGGFRTGAAVFRGGGFRTAHVFRGGGFRHSGFAFRHHRFHHRHFFYGPSYYAPSYYYYPHRYCRVVWTYYGPRKICRYRPWYRHHWRHHYRRHIYW